MICFFVLLLILVFSISNHADQVAKKPEMGVEKEQQVRNVEMPKKASRKKKNCTARQEKDTKKKRMRERKHVEMKEKTYKKEYKKRTFCREKCVK